jgi:hypothetical protein
MYNMGFRINDVLMEIMFVREMLLAGLTVKRISRTAYSVTNVNDEWVSRIMKHTDKWWYF